MLKHLRLVNTGPAPELGLEFGARLNLLTGDNGLGKSFLLDIAWWALTRRWPAELNGGLVAGRKAIPAGDGPASIDFSFTGKLKNERYTSEFQRREQSWGGRAGRPSNPGLVFYAMADGSFAVWDPARNYWRTQNGVDHQERVPAYIFAPGDVWNGLYGPDRNPLCNGLIADWAAWQKEGGRAFQALCVALQALSPASGEPLVPGRLMRVSLDDARDIPSIRMPYGKDVPVLHASAGVRRILALAYLLVWAMEEHAKAAQLLGEQTTRQAVLLIDEVESHLHPQWQRKIVPALLDVIGGLVESSDVQILAATHSPLIMASVEPYFDERQDAWFDLDLVEDRVVLTHRAFEKHGDASAWLVSEAFDLDSTRAVEHATLLDTAEALIDRVQYGLVDRTELAVMNERLVTALNPKDEFLLRWRFATARAMGINP